MTRLFFLTLRRFTRPIIVSLTIILTFVLLFVNSRTISPTASAQPEAPQAVTPTAVFNADPASLGPIPDGTGLSPLPAYGLPRDVTFTVTGLSGVISNVAVSFTSGNPSHTFRGDIEAVLKAPGGTPSFTLFSRTGATSTTSFGSNADLTGPYTFTDSATGQNWWDVPTTPTTPGSYRTIMPGPSTTTPAVTSINAALATGNANGIWTLSFRDGAQTDTGSISAASLTLTTGAVVVPPQHVVDFNGDGKTDYALTRNTGGGASGQLTWFVQLNGGSQQGAQWGIASDSLAPGDFDGDNKTDYAVWRPGPPQTAAFYILQSQTNTVRIEPFGQTGDILTVGDWDGDGKADPATYREGAQSTFFYRGSLNNPAGNITYLPWGITNDRPVHGDFDGDGKQDVAIFRPTNNQWIIRNSSNSQVTYQSFGLSTDKFAPADYDGDGKTDPAVFRGGTWYILQSSNNQILYQQFGLAGDQLVPGDYDGDGRADIAVYRGGIWYGLNSGNGLISYTSFGTGTDTAIAAAYQ